MRRWKGIRGSGGRGKVCLLEPSGEWLQGAGIKGTGESPAHALFPTKVTRSIQASVPQGFKRTERARFTVRLNIMVGLL